MQWLRHPRLGGPKSRASASRPSTTACCGSTRWGGRFRRGGPANPRRETRRGCGRGPRAASRPHLGPRQQHEVADLMSGGHETVKSTGLAQEFAS
jgi:hypothetical protein